MRLLVTGAAGFIGSNFIRHVLESPVNGVSKVFGLDKLTYAGVYSNLGSLTGQPKFIFKQGDICNSQLVAKMITEVDAVINFAAESHVDRSIGSAEEFVETNVVGVQVL